MAEQQAENMFTMDDSQGAAASTAPDDAPRADSDKVDTPASQEASSADAPAESAEQPRHVPLEALTDERGKRQKAQEEAAYWKGIAEGRSQSNPQQQQQQTEQADEEWNNRFFDKPKKAIGESWEEFNKREFAGRLRQTVEWAREDHEDYSDMAAKHSARAETDPRAAFAIRNADNPAEKFLEFARKWDKESASKNGGGAFAGKTEAEVRAMIRAEFEAEAKGEEAVAAAKANPTTTAGARGSGKGEATPDAVEPDGMEPFGMDIV